SPARTSTPAARYARRSSATARDRLFLEDELAPGRVVGHRLGVVAVEAGEAEPLVGQVERVEHALDREIAERIGPDERPDLLDRMVGRDQLGLDLGVDPVEAGVVDRRGADPDV